MNSHVFDGNFEEIYTVCSALPEISPWASMVWVLRFPIVTGSKQLSYHYITLRKQRAKRNFETTRTRKTLSTTNISTTTTHVSGLKIHLNCSPLEPQCCIHELKHLSSCQQKLKGISLYMLTKKQQLCHLSLQAASMIRGHFAKLTYQYRIQHRIPVLHGYSRIRIP